MATEFQSRQFFLANGSVNDSGTLTFYLTGTLTLANVFADSTGTNTTGADSAPKLTNPHTLNGNGKSGTATNGFWLGTTANYDILVKDSSGNLIDTYTNVTGIGIFTSNLAKLQSNLDVNGYAIASTNNGDVNITPNGTGTVKINTNSTFTNTATFNNLTCNGTFTLTGAYNQVANFSVNTNKFTVNATSGNTLVAGTFTSTGAGVFSSTLESDGDFSVNTNKFNVTAASGNTTIAGTLGVTGVANFTTNLNVNTNKFNVTAASGNTTIAGTLGVTGAVTLTVPLAVTQGGIGVATLTTAYGTLCAGTTATGTVQTVSPGSSGQVLTSAGSSALPSYQTLTFPTVLRLGTGVNHICTIPGFYDGITSDSQTQTMASALNTLQFYIPFYVYNSVTVNALYVPVKTGAGSSRVNLGIYASDPTTRLPTGSVLVQVNPSTASNGLVGTGGLSQVLTANTLYYAAIQLSTATTLAVVVGAVGPGASEGNETVPIDGTRCTKGILAQTNTYSAGAMPTVAALTSSAQVYAPFILVGT